MLLLDLSSVHQTDTLRELVNEKYERGDEGSFQEATLDRSYLAQRCGQVVCFGVSNTSCGWLEKMSGCQGWERV